MIHQALKYALKTDLVSQNVALKVDRPKKNDFQPVFLDAAELQHLFEVIKGTKLELPVLVAAFTPAARRSMRTEMGRYRLRTGNADCETNGHFYSA